jgi:hypothetical protein
MKAFLGAAGAIVAASATAAHPQVYPNTLGPSAAAERNQEIIVEARRLATELKNTTLEMVRGRDMRATFRLRADGTFVSAMNGLQSDFGKWRVEGDRVCFDGRKLDTFCSANLLDRHPGDSWVGTGYDGKRWEARLIANR